MTLDEPEREHLLRGRTRDVVPRGGAPGLRGARVGFDRTVASGKELPDTVMNLV